MKKIQVKINGELIDSVTSMGCIGNKFYVCNLHKSLIGQIEEIKLVDGFIPEIKEKIYDFFVDLAVKINKTHGEGLNPSFNDEVEFILNLLDKAEKRKEAIKPKEQ